MSMIVQSMIAKVLNKIKTFHCSLLAIRDLLIEDLVFLMKVIFSILFIVFILIIFMGLLQEVLWYL